MIKDPYFVEFNLPDGKAISDLLTDYALAFIKERDSEEMRGKIPIPARLKNNSTSTR